MLDTKKLIALLALSALSMQGCSKGVTPTPNISASSVDEAANNTQISDTICQSQGDVDTDGDGICDKEDVAADGTDCSQTADSCISKGISDGLAKPSKNNQWLYIGAPALAVAGTLIAKGVTGHFFWDGGGSNDSKDVVKIANDGKNIDAKATENFAAVGSENYSTIRTQAKTGRTLFTYVSGELVQKGDNIISCTHGRISSAYKGTIAPLTQGDTFIYRVDVTFKFYEGASPSGAPSYYDLDKKILSQTDLDLLCSTGKLGQYVAYQLNDGNYYVAAVPLTEGAQAQQQAITITYLFNGIPTDQTSALALQYRRYDPLHISKDYGTTVYDAISHSPNFTDPGTTDLRFKTFFAGVSNATTATSSNLIPNIQVLQPLKNAAPKLTVNEVGTQDPCFSSNPPTYCKVD